MSRTLIDISRLGTETTWPSVATEVNRYLQNWIAAANAQVSQHQLRIATPPNAEATSSDPCGWRLEATLSQLTPGGDPAVLLLGDPVSLTGCGFTRSVRDAAARRNNGPLPPYLPGHC